MKLGGNSAQWANYPGTMALLSFLTEQMLMFMSSESNAWMVRILCCVCSGLG
jgi:hypothetical protein